MDPSQSCICTQRLRTRCSDTCAAAVCRFANQEISSVLHAPILLCRVATNSEPTRNPGTKRGPKKTRGDGRQLLSSHRCPHRNSAPKPFWCTSYPLIWIPTARSLGYLGEMNTRGCQMGKKPTLDQTDTLEQNQGGSTRGDGGRREREKGGEKER